MTRKFKSLLQSYQNMDGDFVFEAIDQLDRRHPIMPKEMAIELLDVISNKEVDMHSLDGKGTVYRDMYSQLMGQDVMQWQRPMITHFDSGNNIILFTMAAVN